VPETTVTVVDQAEFRAASRLLAAAEREGWTEERCTRVAGAFESIGRSRGFAAAWFDAGLALSRCAETAGGAEERFLAAVRADPHHAPARVQLGVLALHRGRLADADRWLVAAVEADPQNADASINLAILRRRRRAPGDLEAAQVDLRRALAVDARNVTAFTELAQLYLDEAGERPGRSVELAATVCRQAAQIDPRHAPLHNTCGLVQLRKGNVVGAVASFERALALDPGLYEAAMNLGSLAASYRGYGTARGAFEKAIAARPGSYDAHNGLGVALRGLSHGAPPSEAANAITRAAAEYVAAIRLDAARPEAYFNLAVLNQDFRSGAPGDLQRAVRCLDDFAARGAGSPRREDAERRRQNALDALAALGAPAGPAARCTPE